MKPGSPSPLHTPPFPKESVCPSLFEIKVPSVEVCQTLNSFLPFVSLLCGLKSNGHDFYHATRSLCDTDTLLQSLLGNRTFLQVPESPYLWQQGNNRGPLKPLRETEPSEWFMVSSKYFPPNKRELEWGGGQIQKLSFRKK